jgi:hypothetical protein
LSCDDRSDYLLGDPNWIELAGRDKPTKFDQINPAFPGFNLGDPTMWDLQPSSQIALRKASILTSVS